MEFRWLNVFFGLLFLVLIIVIMLISFIVTSGLFQLIIEYFRVVYLKYAVYVVIGFVCLMVLITILNFIGDPIRRRIIGD